MSWRPSAPAAAIKASLLFLERQHIRICQICDCRRRGDDLVQQINSFVGKLCLKESHSGNITAWLAQASDEAEPHGVLWPIPVQNPAFVQMSAAKGGSEMASPRPDRLDWPGPARHVSIAPAERRYGASLPI